MKPLAVPFKMQLKTNLRDQKVTQPQGFARESQTLGQTLGQTHGSEWTRESLGP